MATSTFKRAIILATFLIAVEADGNRGGGGEDVADASIDMRAAVMKAVQDGELETLKSVLSGKTKEKVDSSLNGEYGGITPLETTVRECYPKMTRALLEAGATFPLNVSNGGKGTILHLAAAYGNDEIMDALLEKVPGKGKKFVNCEDDYGNTAVRLAVRRGKLELVKKLVRKGASLKAKDSANENVMHDVALEGGSVEMYEYLKAKGANGIKGSKNNLGQTPLMVAAEEGNAEIAAALLADKVDGDAASKVGATALHYAVLYHKPRVVDILLKRGVNTKKKNLEGIAPFDIAQLLHDDADSDDDEDNKIYNMLLADKKERKKGLTFGRLMSKFRPRKGTRETRKARLKMFL